MKRINLVLAVLFVAMSSFAQEIKISRKKVNVEAFDRIRIDASVNVVLFEDNSTTDIVMEGQESSADDILVEVRKGELVVSSRHDRNYKKTTVISIPVKNIKKLEVNKDAMVVAMNVLQSNAIDLAVNSECWMSLKLTGRLNVLKGDATGFITYKNPERVVEIGD